MIDHERIRLLAHIPTAQAADRPHETAIEVEGHTLSFAELEIRSSTAAAMLTDLGVEPGERVAWLGRSCGQFYEIMFGAAKARACLAPVNSRLAIPEIAFIVQDSAARLL